MAGAGGYEMRNSMHEKELADARFDLYEQDEYERGRRLVSMASDEVQHMYAMQVVEVYRLKKELVDARYQLLAAEQAETERQVGGGQ